MYVLTIFLLLCEQRQPRILLVRQQSAASNQIRESRSHRKISKVNKRKCQETTHGFCFSKYNMKS